MYLERSAESKKVSLLIADDANFNLVSSGKFDDDDDKTYSSKINDRIPPINLHDEEDSDD